MGEALITQRYIERDGGRILWRVAINDMVALDVLTDSERLEQALITLENAPSKGMTEYRLGTFGPYDVTICKTGDDASISVDGPDLGNAFRGNQAIVFYLRCDDLITALRMS